MRNWPLSLSLAFGSMHCFDDPGQPVGPDAAMVDAKPDAFVVDGVCPGAGREKIKFSRSESCGNDGSVEWCIPDGDPAIQGVLAAISPTISCAEGGGRARCYSAPGLLLCSYPTAYPAQCLVRYGEMTPEVWNDMCEIASQPQITEIVETIFE